jgi:acyl dehydratase
VLELPLVLKAALPSIPVVNQLPGVRKTRGALTDLTRTREAVRVEREHVDRYAEICGFPTKDTVPLPYPHLLAFELQMGIMTDPGFPAPAIGTVHLENSITAHRAIEIGATVDIMVSVGSARPHPKGTVYDFVTVVSEDGETVWEETSSYLRRGVSTGSTTEGESASSGTTFPDAAPSGVVWKLPADLGRTYASVSGDRNPIHLYALTAKALGFPRQIAHGMWTMARCVGALENRIPDAATVDVAFKRPVLLPGAVAFGSSRLDDGYAFSLTSPQDGSPHLIGRTTNR